MNENLEKRICAIYTRVSTEDQAREGFSLGEQKKRLEDYCKAMGYQIYGYYEDAGISAKTGNKRPEFERMLEDGKLGKFNTVLALKLDRISRSVFDMEKINKYFEDNNLSLICLYDQYDTSTANGRMIQRIMTSVAQNEIDRTSERTKIGMDGAIKVGHIPGKTPLGYYREDKKLYIDPVTSLVVENIYKMYTRGLSHFKIANELNKNNTLNKTWKDCTIRRILANPIYKGTYIVHQGEKNEKIYDNVCPVIIDENLWNYCQAQAPKNARNYQRNKTYLFLQKLCCPKCGRILGGKATRKKNGKVYYYYSCNICDNNINEKKIEGKILRDLNNVFEYDALVHNYYFPLIKSKLGYEEKNYDKELSILENKKERIINSYIDGTFDKDIYIRKINEIDNNINQVKRLMIESKQISKMTFAREDVLVIRDLNYLNKIMLPSLFDYCSKTWNKSSREKKQNIVMDYIDKIELIEKDRKIEVSKIIFRNNFYDDFRELYFDGYLDYDISKRNNPNAETIRFSEYIPIEKVENHIVKLNNFYTVYDYPGIYDFERGILNSIMPDDSKLVRISPNEPLEYNDGYKENVGVHVVGTIKTDDDFTDSEEEMFDRLMRKMEEIKEDYEEIIIIE